MKNDKNPSSIDLLGIKPIGEAFNTTIEKSFEGIEGFLKIVCAPALGELGMLLQDQVRHWRLKNILRILEKSKGKMDFDGDRLTMSANPRVTLEIIENGSLIDNDEVQDMWAGLFASTCGSNNQADENLLFVNILKNLTIAQVKILNYACLNTKKILYRNGLILGSELKIQCDALMGICEIRELHRLDRELDHLRSLQLIGSPLEGGINVNDETLMAEIAPTALALNLYARCQGHSTDPVTFWKTNITTQDQLEEEKAQAISIQRLKGEAPI